jgi:hypothetical protein
MRSELEFSITKLVSFHANVAFLSDITGVVKLLSLRYFLIEQGIVEGWV